MAGRNGTGNVGGGALCVQLVSDQDAQGAAPRWAAWLERAPGIRVEVEGYPLTAKELEGLRVRLAGLIAAGTMVWCRLFGVTLRGGVRHGAPQVRRCEGCLSAEGRVRGREGTSSEDGRTECGPTSGPTKRPANGVRRWEESGRTECGPTSSQTSSQGDHKGRPYGGRGGKKEVGHADED